MCPLKMQIQGVLIQGLAPKALLCEQREGKILTLDHQR